MHTCWVNIISNAIFCIYNNSPFFFLFFFKQKQFFSFIFLVRKKVEGAMAHLAPLLSSALILLHNITILSRCSQFFFRRNEKGALGKNELSMIKCLQLSMIKCLHDQVPSEIHHICLSFLRLWKNLGVTSLKKKIYFTAGSASNFQNNVT